MFKFTLTEKQLVYLGWDDSHSLKREDAELYGIVLKIRSHHPLTRDEMSIVREEIELTAQTFGCDPADARTAKALLKKVATV